MLNKRIVSLAAIAVLVPSAVFAAEDRIDATSTLPPAKPGECYAKVIVPATSAETTEQVLVKPETFDIKIAPATFETIEKPVVIKQAFTKRKAVPASFRTETEEVEVEAASTSWVTKLNKNGIPASPALLAGAKANGINLDGVQIGECVREYFTPAVYETTEKDVLVKEEYEEINVTDAQFETVQEEIITKQASKQGSVIPAVFDTVEERIEIAPKQSIWKKGDGLITKIDNTTGEIMCLVDIPAKYETVKKIVLTSAAAFQLTDVPQETSAVEVNKLVNDATVEKVKVPAVYTKVAVTNKVSDAGFTWRSAGVEGEGNYTGNQVCLKENPAKFKTVKKEVVDVAANVQEEKVAEVIKSIKVQALATEASEIRTTIPAEYATITKTNRATKERLEWKRVLCKTNMTEGINVKIQEALQSAGVYNGPIDGQIGNGTRAAMKRFQEDKGLATGGITLEALEALGVM